MQGFVRVSSYLLQHLRAQEFTLYYTIEHFNITKNFCYASASTLMRMSGIRDKRVYGRAIQTLLKGGLIARHNRVGGGGCVVYQSLYPAPGPEGFPVRKSFLFDLGFKQKQKIIAIGRLVFKALTAKAMSKMLSISVSSIEHAVKVEADQVTILFKNMPQKTQGSNRRKRTIRNALIKPQIINYPEYVNLLGEKTDPPKNTDPVVSHFEEAKHEESEREELEKCRQNLTMKNSLNLLDDAKKYLMLFEDLARIYPTLSEEAITQAIWHTREKERAGKIKATTPMGYAIGIIRQFIRNFRGEGPIPTIERMEKTLLRYRAKAERQKESLARVEMEKQEGERAVQRQERNEKYLELKTISEKDAIMKFAQAKYNPNNLPFITNSFAMKSFLSQENFIEECDAILLRGVGEKVLAK